MAPWKRTLYTTWFAQLLAICGFSMVVPFIPLRIKELSGLSEMEAAKLVGWASFLPGVAMFISAPIWGIVADRYGRKLMIMRATFAGAIIMALMGVMPNVAGIMVCRTLQGVFTGSISASVTLVASVTPTRYSGYALGLIQGAVYSGTFLGPLVGGILCDRFGFMKSCVFAGAALGLGTLLVLFGTREDFTPVRETRREMLGSFRQMFHNRRFLKTALIIFIVYVGACVTIPVFQFFVLDLSRQTELTGPFTQGLNRFAGWVAQSHGNGPVDAEKIVNTLTGLIFGFTGIASAFAAALLGKVGDRWGHRRILMACALLGGMVTIPHMFARTVGELFLLRLAFGFLSAGMVPCANVLIRHSVAEKNVGKAFGINTSIGALGWGLGPLMGGYFTSLRSPFFASGVILMAVAVYVWLIVPQSRHDEPALNDPPLPRQKPRDGLRHQDYLPVGQLRVDGQRQRLRGSPFGLGEIARFIAQRLEALLLMQTERVIDRAPDPCCARCAFSASRWGTRMTY